MRLLRLLFVAIVLGVLVMADPVSPAWADGSGGSIEERVNRSWERSDVPGMVAVVVHNDRIVWSGGVGVASDGTAMSADSVVQVASLTKSFTATAVLELVVDGRILLDDSVTAQLPELALDDRRADQITVRQLLNHTSGLTDADTHFFRAINDGAATPHDVVAALSRQRLTTQPGTAFRYANMNYVLAGRLVEVVTGHPFQTSCTARSSHRLGCALPGSTGAPPLRVTPRCSGAGSAAGTPAARSSTTRRVRS